MKKTLLSALIAASVIVPAAAQAEISANAGVTNNYIWRGLTQTENEAAVQGGLDYASDSGFYAGTWASNVHYGSNDVFSYEHDVYFGFAGESGDISYDVGYLYYNYDAAAQTDFGELYASVGYDAFSATLYILANTQDEEEAGEDFGFGSTYYLSLDYGFEVEEGLEVGLHYGYHDGDFNNSFNGAGESYSDVNVSVTKGDVTFMATTSTAKGQAGSIYDNDSVKFVVSYGVSF